MTIDTNTIVSVTEANQNFSRVTRIAVRGVLTSDIGDRERLMDVIKSFRQIDLVGSVTAKQTKVYVP